jgi:hypothetical protein
MSAEPRAEFPSLSEYLSSTLTPEELVHVGLISFNQWSFALGAVIETALEARALGSDVTVALWANKTPLLDTGWTANPTFARLLGSASRDSNARKALRAAGLPKSCFAKPPIRPWSPIEGLVAPEPATRAAIRKLSYRGSGMGRSILQVHPDDDTPIRDDYVWPRDYLVEAMRSYAWAYDQAVELITRRQISTVVVYNGRFTHDRAVAAAAESCGVRVLYYDTGGYETDFDLTIATTHDWAHLQMRMREMYENWGDDRDEIGAKWFIDRQTHADANNAIFVANQEVGHLEGVPEADRLVVFFSSSGDEIAELELDWSEYLNSQEEALARLALECRSLPGTKLVVRTHPHMGLKPKDDLARWMAAVDAAGPDVHFDPFSKIDSYALMRAADVVFTYGSTSGVESGFIGRPVVVMGPSAYDTLGCALRITSSDEIKGAVENPPIPNPTAAIPYGLMMQHRGFRFAHIMKLSSGEAALGGIQLSEANEFVRKISDFQKQRRLRILTESRRTVATAEEPQA